jgi:hypothetical protein
VGVNIISAYIYRHRITLQQELYKYASDSVLFKRRLRMLSQLAQYESQIITKLYNFESDNIEDYVLGIQEAVNRELFFIINQNG